MRHDNFSFIAAATGTGYRSRMFGCTILIRITHQNP